MRLLALALLLASPILATAQPGSTTRVGVGVSIGSGVPLLDTRNDFQVAAGPQFSIPVDVNGIVRVEPQVGFLSLSQETDGFSSKVRQTSLGLGVSALVPSPDLTLTIGARASYIRLSSEFDSDFSQPQTNTTSALGIGPVLGGEYPFSERFAIGAEAGLQYLTFSNEDDDVSISAVSTNAAVTVRYFF